MADEDGPTPVPDDTMTEPAPDVAGPDPREAQRTAIDPGVAQPSARTEAETTIREQQSKIARLERKLRDYEQSDAGTLQEKLTKSERRVSNLLIGLTTAMRTVNAFASATRETFALVETANREGRDLTPAERQSIVERGRAQQASLEEAIGAELARRQDEPDDDGD